MGGSGQVRCGGGLGVPRIADAQNMAMSMLMPVAKGQSDSARQDLHMQDHSADLRMYAGLSAETKHKNCKFLHTFKASPRKEKRTASVFGNGPRSSHIHLGLQGIHISAREP